MYDITDIVNMYYIVFLVYRLLLYSNLALSDGPAKCLFLC